MHYVEYLRQMVVWNPLFTRKMVQCWVVDNGWDGKKMAKGLANSVRTWQVFLSLFWEEQKQGLARMHGGQLMYHQFQEATSRVTIRPNNSYHRWVGVFSRLEVLLIVKGYLENNTCFCLNRLSAIKHKIRVIRYVDHKWYINPLIDDTRLQWKLWACCLQIGTQLIISGQIHLLVTTLIFSNISWEDMCSRIDRMCYQLHFNIGVNRV